MITSHLEKCSRRVEIYEEVFTEKDTCDIVFREFPKIERREKIFQPKMVIIICSNARSYNHIWNILRMLRMFIFDALQCVPYI